jgi:hypothetical protein
MLLLVLREEIAQRVHVIAKTLRQLAPYRTDFRNDRIFRYRVHGDRHRYKLSQFVPKFEMLWTQPPHFKNINTFNARAAPHPSPKGLQLRRKRRA